MPLNPPASLPIGVRRVLVIDGGPLDGEASAGERATVDLLDALVLLGAEVNFLPMGSKGSRDAALLRALSARGVANVYPPTPISVGELLRADPVEVVIANRPGPAAMASVALQTHPEIASIYWGHDVHTRRLSAQQALRGDVARPHALATTVAERRCWDSYDLTVYPTLREAQLVASMVGSRRAAACPYFMLAGSDLPSAEPQESGRSGILMVGGAAHAPNVDAVEWAIAEVLPRLVAHTGSHARVTIVGDWPAQLRAELAGPGVRFSGRVSDDALRRLHDQSRCLLAPLRFGSGARRKIIAAMGLGLPVITTTEGAQGVLVRDGRHRDDGLLIADAAPAQAAAVDALQSDPALWGMCAARGRRAVADVYGRAHYTSAVAGVLQQAIDIRDARQHAPAVDGAESLAGDEPI